MRYEFDIISLREPEIKWFISHLKSSESSSKLQDGIANNLLIAVSNGSYFPRYEVFTRVRIIATHDCT